MRVSIVNRCPWPVWGLSITIGDDAQGDQTDSGSPMSGVSFACAVVPGWSTVEYQWDFVPPCRGVYPEKPPPLICGFPFGIWQVRREARIRRSLIVWPKVVSLANPPLPGGERAWTGSGGSGQPGDDGERSGVRPFRAGDRMRNVHWAITARYGELFVSDRHATSRPLVLVKVDLESEVHQGIGPHSSREWAIRIAASVCEALLRQGAVVELVSGNLRVTADVAVQGVSVIKDALAKIDSPTPKALPGKPQAHALTKRRASLTFNISSDRCLPRDSDDNYLIILRADTFAGSNGRGGRWGFVPHAAETRPAWISVEQCNDIGESFAEAWRNRSLEAWCG